MPVISINNIKWIDYQGVLVPDEAPDNHISPSDEQAKYLLKTSGSYFLRWISNFDCGYETQFWHVIKDSKSDIELLSQNTRHNVRRGLKRCIIEKTDYKTIIEEGYEVYRKAFDRYKTFIKPFSRNEFIKNINNMKDDTQWDFWSVRNQDKKMIAYSINRIFGNRCIYITTKFHPDYLKLYPGDSLFFEMNSYYLNEKNMKYVDDGPRSLSHKTNIQDYFINKFNFRKAYCRLNIVYNPKIKTLVSMLYPFRKIINKSELNFMNKLSVLLKHEDIRRSFEK